MSEEPVISPWGSNEWNHSTLGSLLRSATLSTVCLHESVCVLAAVRSCTAAAWDTFWRCFSIFLMFKDSSFIRCMSTQIYCSLSRCCRDRVLSETSRLCNTWAPLNFWAGLLFQAFPGRRKERGGFWGGRRSWDVQMQACLLSFYSKRAYTCQRLWLQRQLVQFKCNL